MLPAGLKQRFSEFQQFAVDVVFDRRDGTWAGVFAAFLKVLSFGYSAAVQARLWLYRHRFLRDQPLGCLVVVVGNLTVGGTGKTPVVEKFARALADRGRRVAILSRGYKSRPDPWWRRHVRRLLHEPDPPPRIVSDGRSVLLGAYEAGDEPLMLARNLPGVVVLVDRNRVNAGNFAIRKFGCDTLVLDDGFQYLPLKGALNLLLIDKRNPFGNENLLPRGILREPIKHLRRASYIFLTKSDGRPDPELIQTIRTHHPDVDLIECTHRPRHLESLDRTQREPLDALRGRTVGVFSGIATPESFEDMIRAAGARIAHTRRFLDHHWFDADDLASVYAPAQAAGASWVVTTEKDAVRLPVDFVPPVPTVFLRLEIDILSGAADFEEAVERVCFRTRRTAQPASLP